VERELQVLSGGGAVRMNEFVKKIVLNTLLALLGSLDDVDTDGELRIVVGARDPRAPAAR
jgi:hypothetical protein